MDTHSSLEPAAVRLQKQVDVAEQTLISQRKEHQSTESIGVIFTGNVQHSIPHNLLLDPVLTPVDKTLWMVMRATITNPRAPGYIPSRDELSTAMNSSKPTITKARNTLRIGRWMTYCRTVRDKKQRFLGDVYLLHEEPLSLQDTLELDPGYIQFLTSQAAQSGGSKQNRQFATALLKEIDHLTEVRSPSQREVIERRLATSATLPSMDERVSLGFLGLNSTPSREPADAESQGKIFNPAEELESAGKPLESPGNASQDKNLDAAEPTQGKNFYPAQAPDNSQDKKFAPDSSSCSSSYINKYISTRAREGADSFVDQIRIRLEMADLGFLVTDTTAPKLHAWMPHFPHIPVIGRLLSRLAPLDTRLLAYQIFGRLIAEVDHHLEVPSIRNLVGFTHRLIQRLESDAFALDEWGNRVREAVEEYEPLFL